MFGLILLILLIVGSASLCALYIGVRYHDLAMRACRKIARKLHLYKSPADPIWPILSAEERTKLDNAIKITFTGDLILLRDMVERAYNTTTNDYDFDGMFTYIKPYLQQSDLNIGVFEGPLAGEEKGYTSSNYGDGIRLFINFPDSFANAVKNAGYNFVTLANNHLFDKGIEGQKRTIDVLDSVGLNHIGSYRNQEEHDAVNIIEIRGKRIAFLAYTYGCEYTDEDFFFAEDTAYRTDVIVGRRSKYYRQNRKKVIADFQKVREQNVDLIIVLPHIGKQFRHSPDRDQRVWYDLFIEQGADIIFSCHPHAVQPIQWRKNSKGKNSLIVCCPGNFINSYIEYDGDASMMVEAYLDPRTGEPIAVGCVPIYCYCNQSEGRYTALPIHTALSNMDVYRQLSVADYKRMSAVHKLVTKVAIGTELPSHNHQIRYISFAEKGYARHQVDALMWKEEYRNSPLIRLISDAQSVCFVGDSITDGMKNGGYGWYEPMMQMFPNVKVSAFALGGQTSTYLKNNKETIASKKADVYVVAIGCNDIRYRNPEICAMDEETYISNIDEIRQQTISIQPNVKFVFISPWMSLDPDPYCNTSVEHKLALYTAYAKALNDYANKVDSIYIDPNPYINNLLCQTPKTREDIFIDHIHPNADMGIRVFSEACILAIK